MRTILVALAIALAGCGAAPPEEAPEEFSIPEGAIRGVIVDQTIAPVAGALVTVIGEGMETTSDDAGTFVFDGLAPGTYFLEASHAFYDTQQAGAEVVANERLPAPVKIQLTRQIFDEPYTSQFHLKGYLACSSNTGGVIAEECGEGAGVPCEAPVVGPVPVLGCQRIGGAPDNVPEVTFTTDGGRIATVQAEIVWEPTLYVGNGVQEGGFTAIMATNFVCDPVCRYQDSIDDKVGTSPLIMRTDDGDQGGGYFTAPDVSLADANITAETPISVFVWASDEELAGVGFDQPFDVFVTISYVLPLPEGWAFTNDDELPF